ncbi:MAG: NAD(P)H-hydrate dehydratase [Planctomycetota bacterium]
MQERKGIPELPPRPPDAHKGNFGHAFVLAGSTRMTGAALLTTKAALRSGAGLVTLGVPATIHPLVTPAILSAMTLPLRATPEGSFSRDAVPPAMDFARGVSSIALGPGITTHEDTAFFVRWIVERAAAPLVLDADGLNCLDGDPAPVRAAAGPRVLTPHPGEAARLLGRKTSEIQADRTAAAEELAGRYRAIVVLKGAGTVITDGETGAINGTGNPGMATGGSGDVLTGIVAALLAGGMEPLDAAILGAHVHGAAGDLAAKAVSEISCTARDILRHLGRAFATL